MKNLFSFLRQTIKGKTLYRILFQFRLLKHGKYIKGKVLDIGAGKAPSYIGFLPEDITYIKTDFGSDDKDVFLDFNKVFPYENESFDTVFLFHNLYIAEDPGFVLKEVARVLKRDGHLLVSNPFAVNEMPEPHDYQRHTKEGIESLFEKQSFEIVLGERIGERFSVFAYSLHTLLLFWPIRLVVNTFALFFDMLIPKKIKTNYPLPIGYFYVGRK